MNSFCMNFIISYSKTINLALENEKLIISSIYYTLINRCAVDSVVFGLAAVLFVSVVFRL
jgi:hypothetical protein